jgi:hypothetical protein
MGKRIQAGRDERTPDVKIQPSNLSNNNKGKNVQSSKLFGSRTSLSNTTSDRTFALTSFDSRLLHSMRCAHVHIGPKTHWYISLSMLLLCYTVFSLHKTKEWKKRARGCTLSPLLLLLFFPPSTPSKMHWNYRLVNALPMGTPANHKLLGASWTKRGGMKERRKWS